MSYCSIAYYYATRHKFIVVLAAVKSATDCSKVLPAAASVEDALVIPSAICETEMGKWFNLLLL